MVVDQTQPKNSHKPKPTMMTLLVTSLLGFHATFSRIQASELKNKFLPIKVANNRVLISEVEERGRNIACIDKVLDNESSFMIASYDRQSLSYFFLTEPYQGFHRLEAYIIHNQDEISDMKKWHRVNYPNHVLNLY